MKQMNTTEVKIGDYTFLIKPFPALKAARLTGDLVNLVAPIIGAFSSVGDKESIMDVDLEEAAPAISRAFNAIDGDKIEPLLKTFLINDRNIIVTGSGTEGEILTEDIANEIFCTDIQDMFLLAFEVIKVNYKGFFKKAGNLSGKAEAVVAKARTIL